MEATETSEKPTLIQFALKKGLILGLIHIAVGVLLYTLFPSKLAGFSYLGFVILLNIGFGIYSVIEWRNLGTGYVDFGPAFKLGLLVLVINGSVSSLIFPIIHSSIDSTYPEVFAQAQLDTSIYWAGKFGAPEETLDKMREDMDMTELEKRYSIVGILTGFGVAILFYALGALLIGLFGRKREPEIV